MRTIASISSSITLLVLGTLGVAVNPALAEAKAPGPNRGKDSTPPTLICPQDITAEATGPLGAIVTFSASVTDNADPSPTVTYSPASGSRFPIATTTVTVIAKDWKGNTSKGTFKVTVRDTTPPNVVCPPDIFRNANDAGGAVVTFSAIVTDRVDPSPTVTYSTASGSTFPDGTTTVTVTATDGSGNSATGSFHVTYDGNLTDCPFAGTYTYSWVGYDDVTYDPLVWYEWTVTIAPDGTVSGLGQQTGLDVVEAVSDGWDVLYYNVGYEPMPSDLSASSTTGGHVTDAGSLQYSVAFNEWVYILYNGIYLSSNYPYSLTRQVRLDIEGNLVFDDGEVWYRQ